MPPPLEPTPLNHGPSHITETHEPSPKAKPMLSKRLSRVPTLTSFLSGRMDSLYAVEDEGMKVAIRAFPPEVQRILAPFDRDGDGTLNAMELEKCANAFIESKRMAQMLWRLFSVLFFVLCFLCGVLGGIVYAVTVLTRQLDVAQGSVLTAKGSTTPIQLSATGILASATLTSNLPTEVFNEMRFLQITAPTGAELNLEVTGTVRVPTALPPYGSVVKIFLGALGHAELNGDHIEFSEDATLVFEAAGLATIQSTSSPGRRLLQGGAGLQGVFNTVRAPSAVATYTSPQPQPSMQARTLETLVVVVKEAFVNRTITCPDLRLFSAQSAGVSGNVRLFKVPETSLALMSTLLDKIRLCPEVEEATMDLGLEPMSYEVEPVHDSPYILSRRRNLKQKHAVAHVPAQTPPPIPAPIPKPNDQRFSDPGMWLHIYMRSLEAWAITEGTTAVSVCVTDGGLLDTHPDLIHGVWNNTGEIGRGKQAGVDDDLDGIIDDFHGARIITASGFKDNNITDESGHGTHVSGIIAASINNGIGTAGVAPKVHIISCKSAGAVEGASIGDMATCFDYCYKKGARIFSTSQGACTTSVPARNTLTAVFDRYKDAIFFFSAGNNGKALPSTDGCGFPGNINRTNVLNVGATNWNYGKSSFSNYGPTQVELGAPGEYILSTSITGAYEVRSGTSMAAPAAAGVAALLKSAFPKITVAQIRLALMKSCNPMAQGALYFECGGQIDALNALLYARTNFRF